MRFSSSTSLAINALLAVPAAAFWRMGCPSRLVQERADPVIAPGAVSAHVHTIAGGNGFGFQMSYAQARASTCSSCPITQDLSNYWTPKLYYQAQNGSFFSVPQAGDGSGAQGGMTVYYLQRPGPNNDALKAFPAGFRMVAGDPFQRNYTGSFAAQAVSYVCLNYNGPAYPQPNGLPTQACPDGVRAQIFFPSCWDGVNLDTPDHKSHMAYPIGAYNTGSCPASHPVHMISLFYEVIYQTNNFPFYSNGPSGQPFVFAMGDPTGFGFHGDFVNGWDVNVLQNAVTNCNDANGIMQNCPYFNFFTDAQSNACHAPAVVVEDIGLTGNALNALPGCNPVQQGPGYAKNYASTCTIHPPISQSLGNFKDVTSSLKWKYLGCGTDSVSARTFSYERDSGALTVESCIATCNAAGYSIAGMEYSTQCFCGNAVPAAAAPLPNIPGGCSMKCAGDSTETCGGPNALSLYQKCGSSGCTNAAYTIPGGVPTS